MCYFIFLIFSTVLFSHHKYSHQRTIMLCSCLLSARASHLLPVCQLSAPTSPPAAIRIKMLWTCRPLLLADMTRRDSPWLASRFFLDHERVIGTCFRSAPVPFFPPLLFSWLRLVYLLTVAPIFWTSGPEMKVKTVCLDSERASTVVLGDFVKPAGIGEHQCSQRRPLCTGGTLLPCSACSLSLPWTSTSAAGGPKCCTAPG